MRLHAGRVDLELQGPDLTRAWWGDRELVHRIYVAVRDEAWNTVLPELTGVQAEYSPDSFAVRVDVRHRHDQIDFRWQGLIAGTADGSFEYTMDGQALTPFRYGRIGLCVLHAADVYAGKRFVARSAGFARRGVLPVPIAPQHYRDGLYQPVVSEFDALDVQLSPHLRVQFAFEGDLFEIEDQRNWTDTSFKTYSTPLRLGYPHQAVAGQRFRQRVTITVDGNQPRVRRRIGPGATTIEVGEPTGHQLPAVGTSVPSGNPAEAPPRAQALLRKLGLAHVHADLRVGHRGLGSELEHAAALARGAGAALEVALHVNRESAPGSGELFRRLPADVPVARVLVLDNGKDVTQADAVHAVRRGLREAGLCAPVGGGTALWFAELNRDPPDPSVLDFIAYGLSPQLHLFDDADVMETLAVQGMTVASARALTGGLPVVIGPVMLMPQVGGAVGGDTEIPGTDPRQRSLFCAAWTIGSLRQLALAGAHAVTYFEAFGPRGLIQAGTGADRTGARRARAVQYPVHRVLAEVQRMAGGGVRSTRSSQPLAADALACSDERILRLLVANFQPRRQEVIIKRLPPGVAAVRAVEATPEHVAAGQMAPRTFVKRYTVTGGRLRLTLGGYGFATVAIEERQQTTTRALAPGSDHARDTTDGDRDPGRQVRR